MYSRNQNIKARFIVSDAFDQENFISFSWFDLQYKRSDYVTTYYTFIKHSCNYRSSGMLGYRLKHLKSSGLLIN